MSGPVGSAADLGRGQSVGPVLSARVEVEEDDARAVRRAEVVVEQEGAMRCTGLHSLHRPTVNVDTGCVAAIEVSGPFAGLILPIRAEVELARMAGQAGPQRGVDA